MLFNSFQFLLFFPVVTVLYFLLPHRQRWALLLLASCYFYMAFIPAYILILGITIAVDYCAGIGLETFTGNKRRWLLILSIVVNVGMLAFFKYFNFANENLTALATVIGWNYPIRNLEIILPIGLSFHTFQSLSYTIEVYRGNQKAERHFGYLALYVLFYPQLVAGPIERPQNVLHQFHEEHRFEYQRVTDGLKWMAWGMFKKVVIADRMALFVNPVYDSPQDYTGPALALATLAFAIQIYCDFSGYSDIALGSAQVMGIRLMKNFRRPYFAGSISEFWQRWHISLSTWFRDYLYIPLGGNRHGAWRTALNLFITFLVSGLWHGANWTFIIWGGLHGLFVAIENLLGKMLPEKFRSAIFVSKFIKPVITMIAVCIAWVFFRANSLSDALYIESHFLTGWNDLITKAINLISTSHEKGFWGFNKAIFASLTLVTPAEPYEIVLTLAALGILWYLEKRQEAEDFLFVFNQYPSVVRMVCYALLATTILALGTSYTGIPQAFIYFQF